MLIPGCGFAVLRESVSAGLLVFLGTGSVPAWSYSRLTIGRAGRPGRVYLNSEHLDPEMKQMFSGENTCLAFFRSYSLML